MKTTAVLILLILSYIFLLSYNLLGQPLYLDEGLYIFWASLFKIDSGFAYISMQDGKTPLFIWLTQWLNFLFSNYLYTARFISVIASTITLLSSMVIARIIFGKRTAIFVGVLFLITPFNILISRMGFVDSLLIAFGTLSILSLILIRKFAKARSWILSFICAASCGLFLSLGFMTKTTARLFLVAEIAILGFWSLNVGKSILAKIPKSPSKLLKDNQLITLLILATSILIIIGLYFEFLGYLKFGSLRFWGMIANKEADLIFSLPEIGKNITGQGAGYIYLRNLPLYLEYFLVYFGTILVFCFLGIFKLFKARQQLWLVWLLLIFITGVFLSAKIPASRYLAIIIPEVLILSGVGLNWLWEKKIKYLKTLIIGLLIVPAIFSAKIILSPQQAIYASDDRSYFIESEINAYGLEETIKYLAPQKEKAIIGIQATWGVAEGMLTLLEEQEIETEVLTNIIPIHPSEDPLCLSGYLTENKLCWKANLGNLVSNPKTEKYIYLTVAPEKLDSLKMMSDFEIIKEFKRPGKGITSYLIKLKPSN